MPWLNCPKIGRYYSDIDFPVDFGSTHSKVYTKGPIEKTWPVHVVPLSQTGDKPLFEQISMLFYIKQQQVTVN